MEQVFPWSPEAQHSTLAAIDPWFLGIGAVLLLITCWFAWQDFTSPYNYGFSTSSILFFVAASIALVLYRVCDPTLQFLDRIEVIASTGFAVFMILSVVDLIWWQVQFRRFAALTFICGLLWVLADRASSALSFVFRG